jgi:hypothetical protein
MLDKREDVPLGRAQRIPPAAAAVIDDQDLAGPAAEFQVAARAFRHVEAPDRRQPLQHHGAAHTGLQFVDVGVMSTHAASPVGSGREGGTHFMFLLRSYLLAGVNREVARGKGGRSPGAHVITEKPKTRAGHDLSRESADSDMARYVPAVMGDTRGRAADVWRLGVD